MAARNTGSGGASANAEAPTRSRGDRRRNERLNVVIRAAVRLAELEDQAVARARAVDLSDAGARLMLRRRLPVGSRVVLDLDCELPLRVHLGYEADSLVVDGPMHTHLVRIAGTVRRAERLPNRLWDVGIEFCPDTTRFDELQVMQFYIDHLKGERAGWE
jgi:c-di-GMP-binding flagellar brake protein YcgR